MDIFLIHFKV